MFEVQKKDDVPTTTSLSKLGVSAVGYSAAGIFLIVLNAVASLSVPGLIVGGIVLLLGLGSLASKDPADKKAGVIITSAGTLTILSKIGIPFITPVSGALLGIGAIGLLGMGIWNGIKFLIGLRKRNS
ncbi:MAG: hypothetical protein FWB83_02330 [Treponema sp.]|nr:hypothetical protein [Treponema sp.]